MLRIVPGSLLLAVTMIAVACGGDKNPAGPSGSGHGTLTAVIDGVSYSGTVNTATNINNILNVASNSSDRTRSVNFAVNPAAVGTINVATSAAQMNVITTTGSTVIGSWTASLNIGSGTLTISSLSATAASGTFSFTAPPATPTMPAGSKVVTNGVFNVTF